MLLIIPLVGGLFFLYDQRQQPIHQLEKFIDKHLIPHLLLKGEQNKKKMGTHLLFWSIVWACSVFALAGPRFDFREIDAFTRDQSLAILLDLSESMNAKDISPSRLGRAKQKVEDLLNLSKGVKMGFIAFAADPHMLVPMTEDKETIRHILPSLNTDLVYVQGSKLSPALEMAEKMLENEMGSNKAIVMISDGGFEDAGAIQTAKRLAERGIVLYTIGVGSLEGAPLKDRQGVIVKKNGSPILSKLEKERFSEISKMGRGRYFDADHSEQISLIFEDLEKRSEVQQKAHKTQRVWEEYFYWFLLPVIPFFLGWFRRGAIFSCLLLLFIPIDFQASLRDLLYNNEQQGNEAYEKGDYSLAAQTFQDPYRKGVACYRKGDYQTAEEMFRESKRPEVASSAAYNLGNALVQQNKLQEAVIVYEDVLKKWPDHTLAKENLELVKNALEEQEKKKQDGNEKSQEDSSQQEQDKKEKEQGENESQKDSSSEEKEEDKSQEESTPESEKPTEETDQEQGEPKEESIPRSQEDLDADLWLNQIKNDLTSFLKNKFYLESKKNGTKEEVDPW